MQRHFWWFSACSWRARRGTPNKQQLECRQTVCISAQILMGWLLMLPVFLFIHSFLKWQNLGHLLYVCLNLSRSKISTLTIWKMSCYWTWNIVLQNEPIFVLVKAEGVGIVFSGGLFGGLRPVLSVSPLLVWFCSSFSPWPPWSSLLKYWKKLSSNLSFMENFFSLVWVLLHIQMSVP